MARFLAPVDIANRALQHLGAARIDTMADDSRNASEVRFAYDKLRRAELQRNRWIFAIRRAAIRAIDSTTMLFTPLPWSATTYYQPGQVVSYAGVPWITATPFNYGVTPGDDETWVPYFGPLTLDPYDATESYAAGELVYVQGAFPGIVYIFGSQSADNTTDPQAQPAYDATATYTRGDQVTYAAATYISLIDLNLNNTPASAYALWVAGTTYGSGDHSITADGRIWISQGSGNVGHEPTADDGTHWAPPGTAPFFQPWLAFDGGLHALTWRYLDPGAKVTSLKAARLIYPIGAGPASQTNTRNVFKLPSGFLRAAPQDPNAGHMGFLGGPSGSYENDWTFENGYLVTRQAGVIPLRFIADFTQVSEMDDMFCEGLSCRIAYDLCEIITQSTEKQKALAAQYSRFMTEARLVNAIETGTEEPAEDDFIAARL